MSEISKRAEREPLEKIFTQLGLTHDQVQAGEKTIKRRLFLEPRS